MIFYAKLIHFHKNVDLNYIFWWELNFKVFVLGKNDQLFSKKNAISLLT